MVTFLLLTVTLCITTIIVTAQDDIHCDSTDCNREFIFEASEGWTRFFCDSNTQCANLAIYWGGSAQLDVFCSAKNACNNVVVHCGDWPDKITNIGTNIACAVHCNSDIAPSCYRTEFWCKGSQINECWMGATDDNGNIDSAIFACDIGGSLCELSCGVAPYTTGCDGTELWCYIGSTDQCNCWEGGCSQVTRLTGVTWPPTQDPTTTATPTSSPITAPPTEMPSNHPTTATPTKIPTKIPTNNPTPAPTDNPTPSPTNNPTPSPTDNPTPAPIHNPTTTPTHNPTPSPTDIPTPSPTDNPTPSSTNNPTPSPTYNPTPAPTNNPTPAPTNNPTESPITFKPTNSPSSNPTTNTSTTPSPTTPQIGVAVPNQRTTARDVSVSSQQSTTIVTSRSANQQKKEDNDVFSIFDSMTLLIIIGVLSIIITIGCILYCIYYRKLKKAASRAEIINSEIAMHRIKSVSGNTGTKIEGQCVQTTMINDGNTGGIRNDVEFSESDDDDEDMFDGELYKTNNTLGVVPTTPGGLNTEIINNDNNDNNDNIDNESDTDSVNEMYNGDNMHSTAGNNGSNNGFNDDMGAMYNNNLRTKT